MDDAPPRAAPEPIGAYLATQRRLRRITIEELSEQTRIPLRSLERLESGSFDADIDGFVRGFVRTVAEALGLDPDEALNRTLEEPGQGSRRRGTPRLSLPRVFAAVVVVALLGAAGFGVQWVAISLAQEASTASSPGVTLRRDPIRDLAEAQGVEALAPAPALALASTQAAREGASAAAPLEGARVVATPTTP